jgi:hypothetical protein
MAFGFGSISSNSIRVIEDWAYLWYSTISEHILTCFNDRWSKMFQDVPRCFIVAFVKCMRLEYGGADQDMKVKRSPITCVNDPHYDDVPVTM